MANKGSNRHLKRLAAPLYFDLERKTSTYAAKPDPGRHSLDTCISLLHLVEKLGLAKNSYEAKKIIKGGYIKINNMPIRKPKYPVGLGDVVSIKDGKSHAISIDEIGHVAYGEQGKESIGLHYKVVDKYKIGGNKLVIRLHDGRNMALDEKLKNIHIGDTVVLDESRGVAEVISLREGSNCFIMGGAHIGGFGKILSIKKGSMHSKPIAVVQQNNSSFETSLKNLIVVG